MEKTTNFRLVREETSPKYGGGFEQYQRSTCTRIETLKYSNEKKSSSSASRET